MPRFKSPISHLQLLCIISLLLMRISLHAGSFQSGIDAYENANYATAKQQFTTSLSEEETSATHHDLALTYFQLGAPTEAVWHLERAILLNPFDTEYRYKLGALRQQLGLFNNTQKWRVMTAQALTPNAWICIALVSFWVCVAALLLPIAYGARRQLGIQSIRIIAAIVFLVSLPAIWLNHRELQHGTILSTEAASLHAAPAAAAPQSGSARPGERGRILDQHNNFYEIETESKITGWISKQAFKPLN
jgi:tetratricopeptide (TPR) repeat protein